MLNFSIISNDTQTGGQNSTIAENDIVFALSIIDTVIVAVYIIGSVSLGFYIGRKHKKAEDYFLAGRSMKWPFVGLSLFATNVSGSSLVGVFGTSYENGISVYNYGWVSAVILVLFASLFLPAVLRTEVHTVPQMLELRYNRVVRYYFSLLSVVLVIVGATGSSLYGGALVVRMVFPQLEVWHTVVILAAIAGAYTIWGGLVAVIYTDTVQAVTLVIGSILIAVFTLIEAGGWSSVKNQVPPEHLSLFQPIDDPTVPWTGVLFGMPVLGFYFWCTNQSIVQRSLSSKDSNHGRWGCVLVGFCNLTMLFLNVLPAVMATLIFKDLPKPDLLYPKMMFTLLPVGVLGLVLSGFVAALLSDVDSHLNSASTLITMDFVKNMKPDLTDGQLTMVGKVVTFLLMVVSASWAPFIGNFGSLFQYIQAVISYLTPPVVALYLVGFFWKGANTHGAIAMLIIGNIICLSFFVFNVIFEILGLHFLHVAPILFVINAVILICASLVSGQKCSKEQMVFTWSFLDFKEDLFSSKDRPILQNFHLQALLLLIVTGIIVGLFF